MEAISEAEAHRNRLIIMLAVSIVAVISVIAALNPGNLNLTSGVIIPVENSCELERYCSEYEDVKTTNPVCMEYGQVEFDYCSKYGTDETGLICTEWTSMAKTECVDLELAVTWEKECINWDYHKKCEIIIK